MIEKRREVEYIYIFLWKKQHVKIRMEMLNKDGR